MKLEALPFGVVLTLLAALPSYFNLSTDRIFEEEKSLLFQAAGLVAIPAIVTLARPDMRRVLKNPIVIAFAVLFSVLAIATAGAIEPQSALWGAHQRRFGFVNWAALAMLFAAMLTAVRTPNGRDLIVRATIAGAVWPSVYLLIQRAGLDPIQWIAPSENFIAGGTFGNHVLVGGYLAMVIPLTAYEAWRSSRLWLAILVLEVLALVVSGSRGAMVALAVGGAVAALIMATRLLPRRVAMIAIGMAVIALISLTLPGWRPSFIAGQFDPKAGSARVRVLIWQDTIAIIRAAGPRLLFGYGPESLRLVFPKNYSPEIGQLEQIDAMPDRAHNETLDMTVSAGAAGALAEITFFGAAMLAILRLENLALRCALAAALAAHVVEIQFGIASVMTRLGVLAVVSIGLGAQTSISRDMFRMRYRWLIAATVLGAASPWLSLLPSILANPIQSGGEEQFIAYLYSMSAATPLIYAAFLLVSIAASRSVLSLSNDRGWTWRAAVLAVAVWLGAINCIAASRSDAIVAGGRAYEAGQRWPEAMVAYSAAAKRMPSVADYQLNVARASVELAMRNEAPASDRLLDQAHAALQRAVDVSPADVESQLRLAGYPRIQASRLQGDPRSDALGRADRAYEAVSRLAPTWPPVWVQWGWVDVDRGLIDAAGAKADRALALSPGRKDALELKARLAAPAIR